MTEHDWQTGTDPGPMLAALPRLLWPTGAIDEAGQRRLRLFAVACCRRVEPLLADARVRHALEVLELFADALATAEQLARAAEEAAAALTVHPEGAPWPPPGLAGLAVREATTLVEADLVRGATRAAGHVQAALDQEEGPAAAAAEAVRQTHLLRCLFGNPYRPRVFDPAWGAENGWAARKLAQVIYASRAWGDLPILADALEEAGCADPAILGHCRADVPHGRGCRVVDALLGWE